MKNFYLVIAIQEGGKRYAYAHKQGYNNNLLCLSEKHKNAEYIAPCETWSKAKVTAEAWNAEYKANGKYLFNCPRF